MVSRTRASERTRTRFSTCLCLLLALFLSLIVSGAQAQSLPSALPTTSKPLLLPPTSSAFVQFNDRVLFPVYTLGDETAQDRADLTNLRLLEALRNLSDNEASAQPPQVIVGSRDRQAVLLLDGKLLTVTQADADHADQPSLLLAQTWAGVLNHAFGQALRERQPAYLHWAWQHVALLLGLACAAAALAADRLAHH